MHPHEAIQYVISSEKFTAEPLGTKGPLLAHRQLYSSMSILGVFSELSHLERSLGVDITCEKSRGIEIIRPSIQQCGGLRGCLYVSYITSFGGVDLPCDGTQRFSSLWTPLLRWGSSLLPLEQTFDTTTSCQRAYDRREAPTSR